MDVIHCLLTEYSCIYDLIAISNGLLARKETHGGSLNKFTFTFGIS